MSANPHPSLKSSKFDVRLLEQWACPVCFGALQLLSPGEKIICVECQRSYPLIDGIPVLIPDRATEKALPSQGDLPDPAEIKG
jgi:uncharacterized protein YbaR (Trm112 family)